MIKMEYYKTINGKNLYKVYSDENKYITRIETNKKDIEFIEIEPVKYTYRETNFEIGKLSKSILNNKTLLKEKILQTLKNKSKEV